MSLAEVHRAKAIPRRSAGVFFLRISAISSSMTSMTGFLSIMFPVYAQTEHAMDEEMHQRPNNVHLSSFEPAMDLASIVLHRFGDRPTHPI